MALDSALQASLDELRTRNAELQASRARIVTAAAESRRAIERGLGEALRTAAVRSPLPCAVEVDLPGRYPPDVEACVYFCCLEAVQNAGKHAGPGSEILVRVDGDGGGLRFEVSDDGAGFAGEAAEGHGFVTMRDCLGAVGGELRARSAPGAGTTVTGRVPA